MSSTIDLLLIYPPIAKAAEPPAGMAQIQRALHDHDLTCETLDANILAQKYLLRQPIENETRRLKSAIRSRHKNLSSVADLAAFKKFDHYKRAVIELNRLMNKAAGQSAHVTFVDFKQHGFSPVNSDDLVRAALHPEQNPFLDFYMQEIIPRVEQLAPSYIGISLIYLSQAVSAFALIGLLRRHMPDSKILLGGGLITSWMSQPGWRSPFDGLVDSCIPGRGEQPLLALFDKAADSAFYMPSFQKNSYFSPRPIVPYTTSYGCYWQKCTFCPETAECSGYAAAPHEQVFSDLEKLCAHGNNLIHFLDNALSPALLGKIAQRGLPAPWYGYVRFTEHLTDLDFCMQLKKSGCVMLQLGLESGDQEVLDRMRKGINIDTASRALRNLRRAGIASYVYLLFGTPYETEAQARRTVEFTLDHADCIQYLNPAIFNMPVYSEESSVHDTRPFYAGDLSLYHDFGHPAGWHRRHVRRFLKEEFQSHKVIKKILSSKPPFFTSNHAPFFTDYFLASL